MNFVIMYVCNYVCMIIIIDMYDFVIRRINVELWHCNGMRHSRPKRNAQQFLSLARPTISRDVFQKPLDTEVCFRITPPKFIEQPGWGVYGQYTSECLRPGV